MKEYSQEPIFQKASGTIKIRLNPSDEMLRSLNHLKEVAPQEYEDLINFFRDRLIHMSHGVCHVADEQARKWSQGRVQEISDILDYFTDPFGILQKRIEDREKGQKEAKVARHAALM